MLEIRTIPRDQLFVTKILQKSLWASKSFENSNWRVKMGQSLKYHFFFSRIVSLRPYLIFEFAFAFVREKLVR